MIKFNHIKHNISARDKIADVYNLKHNEIYNDFEQKRLESLVFYIVKKINKGNTQVLDFGAGTGNLTRKFIQNNCFVTACDVSKEPLALLQKELNSENLKTVLYDGKRLPFVDDSFDIVAAYSVLHHIPDYLYAVKEMIRVTKKSGLIYIDHEANGKQWLDDNYLKKYYKLAKPDFFDIFIKLLKTRELFTLDFLKEYLLNYL